MTKHGWQYDTRAELYVCSLCQADAIEPWDGTELVELLIPGLPALAIELRASDKENHFTCEEYSLLGILDA